MELIILGLILVGGVAAVVLGLRMAFSGKGASDDRSRQNTSSARNPKSDHWQELDIEWMHPGSDWVYLPKVDKDNECKLVTIKDMGHREAVKPLIERIVAKQDYTLTLEREPSNTYDPNAIQVVDETHSNGVTVGYLPKHVSATIAERYRSDMPIAVMAKRAIKSPDGEVFLRLSPLVPKKSLRKQYE